MGTVAQENSKIRIIFKLAGQRPSLGERQRKRFNKAADTVLLGGLVFNMIRNVEGDGDGDGDRDHENVQTAKQQTWHHCGEVQMQI